VGRVCGLVSNRRQKPVPNTLLKGGLHGFDRSFQIYCIHSFWHHSLRGSSPASTSRLATGDVLDAPRQTPSLMLLGRVYPPHGPSPYHRTSATGVCDHVFSNKSSKKVYW